MIFYRRFFPFDSLDFRFALVFLATWLNTNASSSRMTRKKRIGSSGSTIALAAKISTVAMGWIPAMP
jgi:hypothetical protein